MRLHHVLFLALILPFIASAGSQPSDIEAIGAVLDDFHDAAAKGDNKRYLGHLTEQGVYLGTDEWERWPKNPVFTDYVNGRFTDDSGWKYETVERTIQIGNHPDIAWFDEVTYSETNGRFRGTGVLTRQDGVWKIEHYAMSFLILNENWDEVIELTRKTRVELEAEQSDSE